MPVKERIASLGKLLLLLMALPLLTGWYFGVWSNHELTDSPENPRNYPRPELRGALRDRAGRLLAYTKGRRRIYPYGAAAAPLVGYFDVRLGTSGLEDAFSMQLQGRQRPEDLADDAGVAPLQRLKGPDVVVTIDAELQKLSYEQLGGRRGAVVLIHVPTGEVLAAASSPSYDPDGLGDRWDDLVKDPRNPLFHRGLAGLYSPGSTFKVLTMIAALSEKVVTPGSVFFCSGGLPIGDFTMSDSHGGHGNLNLQEALAQSCNVTFGGIGLKLGLKKLDKWMKLTKILEGSYDLPGMVRGVPLLLDDSEVATAQAAIGQGTFLVTPAAMARLTATVARGGVDIPPRIYRAEQRGEKIFVSNKPLVRRRVIDAKVAAIVARGMEAVVARGTGGGAVVPGKKVAGKTGTAENPRGDSDAWFVGYAPAQKPLFAVCVLFENRGYGGTYSAPVAGKVLAAALRSRVAWPKGKVIGKASAAKLGKAVKRKADATIASVVKATLKKPSKATVQARVKAILPEPLKRDPAKAGKPTNAGKAAGAGNSAKKP